MARWASGSISLAGSRAGTLSRAALGAGELPFGCGDVLLGGGDHAGVLVGGGDSGVAEHGGEIGLGAAERGLGGAGRVPGDLAGRVTGGLRVGPGGGGVVADLAGAVAGSRVLEPNHARCRRRSVRPPPPALGHARHRRGTRHLRCARPQISCAFDHADLLGFGPVRGFGSVTSIPEADSLFTAVLTRMLSAY